MSEAKILLIVDDEQLLRDALAFDLKRRGYIVKTAADGLEALDIFRANKIDLLLSDVHMPRMNGFELLPKIKGLNHSVPVIMFITDQTGVETDQVYDLGADAVFSKPFDRKALYAVIERALSEADKKWSRKSDRVDCNFEGKIQANSIAEGIQIQALNIGRGGIFIAGQSTTQLSVGMTIKFSLTPNNVTEAVIEGEGIVRWIRRGSEPQLPDGVGIEFTYLSNGCREQIEEILRKIRTSRFIPRK